MMVMAASQVLVVLANVTVFIMNSYVGGIKYSVITVSSAATV